MKVHRSLLGKYVELVWRDPCSAHIKSHHADLSDLPRGRDVLAVQRERGVVADVTDGVVRLHHSEGRDSVFVPDPSTDIYATWVPEDLIESLTVMEPQRGAALDEAPNGLHTPHERKAT